MIKQLAIFLFLLSASAYSQNIEGQIVAAQFGVYQVTGYSDETSTTSFTFPSTGCQVSGGGKNFNGVTAGVPIKIVDGNPLHTEIVTPSAVDITVCKVTANTTYSHQLPYFLTSGTGGLQEAINANGSGTGANTIVLNSEWYALVPPGNAASVIASVHGNTSLGLVDVTTTPYTYYSWGGSAYAATTGGTSSGSAILPGTPNVVYTFVQPGDQTCTASTGTIRDISGSGNNATIGSTAPTCDGLGMTFSTSGAQATIPAATGNDESFCATVNLPVYSGPSGALTAPQYNYILDSSTGANGTGWIVGANNQVYQQQTYGGGFKTTTNDAEAGTHTLCLVLGLSGNSTNDRFFVDGVESKYSATGRTGGTNGANPWYFGQNFLVNYSPVEYFYFAGWPGQLTPSQISQASLAMNATVTTRGVQTSPANNLGAGVYLMGIGDSITEAFGATSWLSQLSVTGGYTLVNQGIYGISAQANLGFARWRDAPLCNNDFKTVAITFNGTNDVANGVNPGTVIGYLMAQANMLEKAGCIVGVGTMISRTGQDTNKDTLNGYIRTNAAYGGYSVVDFASTPLGADGAYANGTNFQGDGVHPTTAGQLILAGAASNWVNAYGFASASESNPTVYSSNAVTMVSADRFATIIPTAAATATLPDCLGVTGTVYQIFNSSAGANTITFSGKASEAITGSATLAQNGTARFQATLISQAAAGCGWQRVQ